VLGLVIIGLATLPQYSIGVIAQILRQVQWSFHLQYSWMQFLTAHAQELEQLVLVSYGGNSTVIKFLEPAHVGCHVASSAATTTFS
jgi:hypothetical protein